MWFQLWKNLGFAILDVLTFGKLTIINDFNIEAYAKFIFKIFPKFKIFILENCNKISSGMTSWYFGLTTNQAFGIQIFKIIISEYLK